MPPQHDAVLEVLAHIDPDILLLSGIDYDAGHRTIRAIQNHLSERGLQLPYHFAKQPNWGVPTGLDLDKNGQKHEPEDAQGFGHFLGAGGMALLSRFPVVTGNARTFEQYLWADLPNADTPFTLDSAEAETLRLSGSGHWDVPIRLENSLTIHILAVHATPPVFDGPEDRNGRRNADQIRFWVEYLNEGRLPVAGHEPIPNPIIVGTLNADPKDGDARRDALIALLRHPVLQDPEPFSKGGVVASLEQGGVNARHESPPALDTVDWPEDGSMRGPGNLRVDYILPAQSLEVLGSGVFWPESGPMLAIVEKASRHRLIWADLKLPSTP